MDLDVFWHPPVDLHDGSKESLILTCDLEQIPEEPGVYAFCRMFGEKIDPLYIGQAKNLRGRIRGHFKHNVQLMHKIVEAKIGPKVVLPGEWKPKRGQSLEGALDVIEAALIKYALAEGHELFNVQGAKRPVHTINSSGNRDACPHLFHRSIKVEKR
jgi:hypothetical protein